MAEGKSWSQSRNKGTKLEPEPKMNNYGSTTLPKSVAKKTEFRSSLAHLWVQYIIFIFFYFYFVQNNTILTVRVMTLIFVDGLDLSGIVSSASRFSPKLNWVKISLVDILFF